MSLCGNCLPTTTTTNVSCPDCLQVPSLYVSCMNSIIPGESGQVNVGENVVDTPCSGAVYYELISFDTDFFSAASINSSTGILDFTIDPLAVEGTSGEIKGKAWCTKSGGVGVLSQFFTVNICAKEDIPV